MLLQRIELLHQTDISLNSTDMSSSSRPSLSIGFLLMPDFTLLALAAFIDTLRLAADEGDRSRPIRCAWTLMSETGAPVRASSGILVEPSAGLVAAERFDYVVVVGGTMHRGPKVGEATYAYLRSAAAARVPLVGICTGGFVLARAGLMTGRRCCISWFHRDELAAEFPDLSVIADELYTFDRDRITCAGGTSVIHLASELVERHVGTGSSQKGLRVMLEDRARTARSPQPPHPIPGIENVHDHRVRRAMLMIERTLLERQSIEQIAEGIGTTARQLSRIFVAETGMSPGRFREALRLNSARSAILGSRESITGIAARLGFADAAHLSRSYKRKFGSRPRDDRLGAGSI